MNRLLVMVAAVASLWLIALPASSMASTRVGVSINIGDPYRGAALPFRSEPDVVLVPETRVYYVRNYDYDVYRYGSYWYFIDDGRWYRARSYRGPFLCVHETSVPRSIERVPVRYRRHWGGPPPHAVARGYRSQRDIRDGMWVEKGRDKRQDDRDNSGVEHGNGKHQGKGHK